jgi:hypothetical protein
MRIAGDISPIGGDALMATEREVLIAQPASADGMKISWGGVFGGVLAGVGALMLLTTLGLAIGVSATDPQNPDARTLGAGAAIWTTLSLLIALFVAGWASTRLSMLWERTTAMFEGALVWVMSLILILYLTANGIGLVASGAFGLLGSAAQGAGSAVGSVLDTGGISSGSTDEILQKLRDPTTAAVVANATGMSQQEATQELSQISGRVEAARNDPAQAASQARQGLSDLASRAKQNLGQRAAEVKPEVARSAWLAFAALVLSLLAAIGGAATGRRNVLRRAGR